MGAAGTVRGLWRHPVKSMQGESLQEVDFSAEGMAGDRRWGVIDADTGKVLSAKRFGRLLEARATLPGGASAPVVELPDGECFEVGDDALDGALTEWLGRPVSLGAAPAGAQSQYDFKLSEFGVELDVPDEETVIDTPPGTFYDLATAHVLTTASMAAGRRHHPEGDWDVRRFRPQIVVDNGDDPEFVENDWVGSTISIGEVGLSPFMPTVRCVMPTRPQPGLDRDRRVAQVLKEVNGSNLGVYAAITDPGRVAVGDPVEVTPG